MSENNLEIPSLDVAGLFDSHAHYFDSRYERETEGSHAILTEQVFGKGIEGVINVGTNNRNNRRCIAQAIKYENMYVAVGIHPEDVSSCQGSIDEELSQLCELVATPELIKSNKIVAIG